MNGYKAIYKGCEIDVWAESIYRAQLEAAKIFKTKKPYDVIVMLCELNTDGTESGEQAVHKAVD